ncbi:MAG: isoprenylcysteine carboxylmethyltransferase family protein, partial [Bradyrhizobium sp.]
MIAKWLFQTLAWILALAVLLFVPAGTLRWPAAWVFLGFMLALGLGFGGWLARKNPALLAERMRPPIRADQPLADKKLLIAFGIVNLIW